MKRGRLLLINNAGIMRVGPIDHTTRDDFDKAMGIGGKLGVPHLVPYCASKFAAAGRPRRFEPRVGCSGWNYKDWRGRFYPNDLPVRGWLEYYAARFDTVEANSTFYRLPERATFAAWSARVPKSFVMAVKASRFLTHMKRLRDPEEPLARLLSRAEALGTHLGPVLYQLPPDFTLDLPRLDVFLRALPRSWSGKRLRHVLEFRHPSWYVRDLFELLDRRGIALCLHDKAGSSVAEPFVGPFVYVRFHGASGEYHGSYSSRHLDTWARRLAEQTRDGRAVFAYFNNDPQAVAVSNALALRAAMSNLV
jgi:uncharacterized protein YecE (DUF72 family)